MTTTATATAATTTTTTTPVTTATTTTVTTTKRRGRRRQRRWGQGRRWGRRRRRVPEIIGKWSALSDPQMCPPDCVRQLHRASSACADRARLESGRAPSACPKCVPLECVCPEPVPGVCDPTACIGCVPKLHHMCGRSVGPECMPHVVPFSGTTCLLTPRRPQQVNLMQLPPAPSPPHPACSPRTPPPRPPALALPTAPPSSNPSTPQSTRRQAEEQDPPSKRTTTTNTSEKRLARNARLL